MFLRCGNVVYWEPALEAPRIHGELRKFGFCGHLMKHRQYMVNTRLVGSVVVGKSAIVEGDYCAASAFSYNQDP
jgi:hypothetical protein